MAGSATRAAEICLFALGWLLRIKSLHSRRIEPLLLKLGWLEVSVLAAINSFLCTPMAGSHSITPSPNTTRPHGRTNQCEGEKRVAQKR